MTTFKPGHLGVLANTWRIRVTGGRVHLEYSPDGGFTWGAAGLTCPLTDGAAVQWVLEGPLQSR